MITIAHLTNSSLSPMGDALVRRGFAVHEAVSISEITYLCEHYSIDVVIIAHGVETLGHIQGKQITLHLKAQATVADVVWELTNLFPGRISMTVQ
ncbi:MAG: hypothetical protein JWO13_524 [Acidobacteriales bacterium]|nr:hypothetical protein [Terriglobales bacterium]